MDNQAQDTKEQQLVFFSYIDKETGKVLAQDQASGQSGQPIEYQPNERLATLEKQGYTLAYNGFPQGARYSENDQMNQVFAILLKHKQKLVMADEIQGNSAS
ncbi:MAG: mucin-binding protein [Limosilactobacillus pontis]